ncbi:SRPBCC family protein [Nocardioides sp. R-C-SC26]|uniref:SRPBCC family protein n=1 Tax=Nocardioides sp. R-C-SC26 TaxID=2870414 RepID=UPI001E561480|nr:SRPBCC family protein [Nocardioides sp. R-C-SC26]
MRSTHVSVVIDAPPQRAYDIAGDPAYLPRWAAGLAQSDVVWDGEVFGVQSPMGEVTVRFAARNDYGVLDHDVTLPSGVTVNNPLRVLAHPRGSEVVFTIRQLDLSDADFERDVAMVQEDLERLRDLVERTQH